MKSAESRLFWGLCALALLGFLVHGLSFGFCPQDDTYISLRYARNLVAGQGMVFNPGERVEGVTNFLWTVLSTIPFLLGCDPVGFLRFLGLLAGACGLLAAAALTRELAPEARLGAGIAAVLGAGIPFWAAEGVMGLETDAFAALAVGGVAAFLRERRLSSGFPWSGGLLALAVFCRPEGMLIAGAVFLTDLLDRRWAERWQSPLLVRWSLFGLPLLALTLFRWFYFGDLVPNTFHAKVGGGWAAWGRGIEYFGGFLWVSFPVLLLGLWGLWCLIRRSDWDSARSMLVIGLPLVFLSYVIYVGGDYKPTFRFFATPTLFGLALAGCGAERLVRSAGRIAWGRLVFLVCGCAGLLIGLGRETREFAFWRAAEVPVHLAAGKWLGENYPPQTWLATANAGAIPYASNLPTVDMLGLCDRHIAHRKVAEMGKGFAGHEKGDGAYILARRPQIILFQLTRFSDGPVAPQQVLQPLWLSERELVASPQFAAAYAPRSVRLPGFYFHFIERRSRP